MPWTCRLLQPTNRYRRYLRRYRGSKHKGCALRGYHDERFLFDEVRLEEGQEPPASLSGEAIDQWMRAVDGWPRECGCGYLFVEEDPRQVFVERLYVGPSGSIYELRAAPPGSMWLAPWLSGWGGKKGPHLVVKLPCGGDWDIDGPMKGRPRGVGWERSGEPPNVTVSPAIVFEGYQGRLVSGVFSDDLRGRPVAR